MCRGKTEVVNPRTDSKWLFRSGMYHFHFHLLARESHMVKLNVIGATKKGNIYLFKTPLCMSQILQEI